MEIDEKEIICPECGTKNPADKILCGNCGFNLELIKNNFQLEQAREIEAELKAKKDAEILNHVNDWERTRLVKLLLGINVYIAIVLTVSTLIITGFVLRFLSNWPYESRFHKDTERLVDTALKVKAGIEMDVNKEEFERLVRELMAESARYIGKYEESNYRSSELYTALRSSSNFYAMSNEAWENEMKATYGRTIPTAPSSTASENVRKLWHNAEASLARALKKL